MPKKKENVREVAISFVRRIRLEEKPCPVCGSKFTGTKKSRYCSRACQNKAHYERHAKEYRQARMEKYHAEKKVASEK